MAHLEVCESAEKLPGEYGVVIPRTVMMTDPNLHWTGGKSKHT